MKVLAFAASLRKGSLNRKLLELAVSIAREQGFDVELVDFREFDMPLFDGDYQHEHGLPEGAKRLEAKLRESDALLLASPEYNYSVAGPLKNAIDWVSRARPMPWRGKSVYLLSASPGPIGGIRGLWQTRIPLEGCGALVFPDMFALANAADAFDADGRLTNAALGERLSKEVVGFLRMAEAVLPVVGTEAPPRPRTKQIAEALEEQTKLQPPA